MRTMPRLSIHVLGTPEILVNGIPLELSHIKARALLYYLAGTGERHGRDHLATLLWSEKGTNEAHHSLRSSVYHIRQAIQPSEADSILISDSDLLFLNPDAYECDLIEFRRLLADGSEHSLQQAVKLYRGPFLQGFGVANALAFDEWVQAQNSSVNRICFDTIDRLSGLAESRKEWGDASRYLHQMLQIDAFAETAQQRLISLYLHQGEISLALRQYRQFESMLQRELNVAPVPETQALLTDILRRQRFPTGQPLPPGRSSIPRAQVLPFVGREDLLRRLTEISKAVIGGEGTTILIEGEVGIGKTRLVEEMASQLIMGTPPWMVLQGACSPFDDLRSQGPFLEALESAIPGELNELLDLSAGSVPDARGQFSWRILQIIRSLSNNAPLLFLIEDLQWANSATLNLLGFLTTRLRHLPVLIVATVRQAEAIPALQRLIIVERHHGQLTLLNLAALGLADVINILHQSAIQSAPPQTLAEWLLARSGGSPFLLTEILAQMRSDNILQATEAGWQLDTTGWLRWRTTFNLPETTYDLVAWRLSNLSPQARHILDVLAVAGQPLPEAILQELPSIQADSFPSLADDLVSRGLVMETLGTLLALPHHLLRETLLHRLSNLRRRRIFQQLAEALEHHLPADSSDPLRETSAANFRLIALYSVAGEDSGRARRYGLRILSDLSREYSGAESIDFVQHLHDLLAPDASPGEMVRLTSVLGALHQSVGHLDVAAQWYQQDLEWAQKAEDEVAKAEAYFEMAELALISNNYQEALRTAQEGLSEVQSEVSSPLQYSAPLIQSLIGKGHRLMGAAYAMEGSDLDAAEQHLQEAIAIQRQLGKQEDICAALFELGNIAAQRGELYRALDFYTESARAAEVGRIHYYLALARNNFAYHSLLLGNIDDAQKAVADGLKVAETHDLMTALLHLYSTDGEIHLYLAEWEKAQESFQHGLTIAEDLGSLERQAGYRGGLALAARGRNDFDTTVRLLKEALALIAGQGYWHLHTRLQLWLAGTMYQQEHYKEALLLVDAAINTALSHRRILLLIEGECLRAGLLTRAGDWPTAVALFTDAMESAASLGLPLEIARVQLAWGKAMLHQSETLEQGEELITAGRTVLADHSALADLAWLTRENS